MILQGALGGPHTRRARLALHAAGVSYQFEAVKDDSPELDTKAGDEVLRSSVEIVDWALDQEGAPRWWDETDVDQLDDSLYLIELCDGPFADYVDALAASGDGEAQVCAEGFVEQLTQLLEQSTDHAAPALLGQEIGLADFSIWPFVERFESLSSGDNERALVWQNWCEIMRAQSSWRAVIAMEQP